MTLKIKYDTKLKRHWKPSESKRSLKLICRQGASQDIAKLVNFLISAKSKWSGNLSIRLKMLRLEVSGHISETNDKELQNCTSMLCNKNSVRTSCITKSKRSLRLKIGYREEREHRRKEFKAFFKSSKRRKIKSREMSNQT